MKLTKILSAIALALLSYNAFASDVAHEEGEKLYKAQCASCHGATGGMDMNKRLAPPIAGVRMHYISAHPDKDAFVTAISGWLASQDETKSLMPGAIRKFKLMPPLEIALEDAEKIAAYIYAGKLEKLEGFDKHVEQMHGKKGMGKGMRGKGMQGMGQGMNCKGMSGMSQGMQGKGKHGMGQGMNCKGMPGMGKGMYGKGMHGMGKGMYGKGMPGMGQGMHGKGMPRGSGMMPAQMQSRMMQQFGLSADQMTKMQALMQGKSATMQSLNQQEQQLKRRFEALDTGSASYKTDIFDLADEQAMLSRRNVIESGEMRYKLDSLLSPEQRQRFAQMRAKKSEMKQRMHQKMNKMRMRPGGMPKMKMPTIGNPPLSMPQMEKPTTPAAASTPPTTPPKSE